MSTPRAEETGPNLVGTVALQLRRLALVGSQGGLLISFVSVESCNGGEPEVISGLDLVASDNGWVLAIPLALATLLLATSVRRRSSLAGWRAFSASTRALVAAVSGLVAGGLPHVVYLFDTVRPRAGWFVVVACWTFIYLEGLAEAAVTLRPSGAPRAPDLWDPVCRVLSWLVLVLPWPVALLIEPDLDEAVLGAATVTFAIGVPLWLALTGCVAGLRREEPWASGWAPVVAGIVAAAAAFSCLGASLQ